MKGNYEIVCRGCGQTVTLVGLGVGKRRAYCQSACKRENTLATLRVSQREHRERVAARLAVLERLVADAGLEVVNG